MIKIMRWNLGRRFDVTSIMDEISGRYEYDGTGVEFSGFASITDATPDDLAFCSVVGQEGVDVAAKSNAGVILCSNKLKGMIFAKKGRQQIVFVDNPRFVFTRFVNLHHCSDRATNNKISSSAIIHSSATVGADCVIGEYVTIGENCVLEDNVIVEDGVHLVRNSVIGSGSILQSGVTIGSAGFAFERLPDGSLERFPHAAGVIVGRNVEICANCSITGGSLTNTIIGDGTKIDALVHIAHNVRVGKNCQLAAGTIVGGSTVIGDSCWLGLNSTLKNQISIGDHVLVAAGACVIKDVPPEDVVAGVPAKSIRDKVSSPELFLMRGIS